jgi:hypothetical protein
MFLFTCTLAVQILKYIVLNSCITETALQYHFSWDPEYDRALDILDEHKLVDRRRDDAINTDLFWPTEEGRRVLAEIRGESIDESIFVRPVAACGASSN